MEPQWHVCVLVLVQEENGMTAFSYDIGIAVKL
jgi:hypothetical protein